ncbi:MAG TPA: GntR family transcriptional regulator [Saprospiraceae bacterium]|nr:GntR family transcriptional regulator [Saprospiraceae bacterium]
MKLQVDQESGVPLHSQVEKLLRRYIEKERDSENNGRMFPKEVDLARELGVARNTVRQAISKLVQDGLLVRKKGVGTYIADKKIYTRLDHWFSFTREMEEKGLHVVNHEQEVGFVKADEEIAEIFNIRKKINVVMLRRLRGTAEHPYLLSISWFHPRTNLNTEDDFSRPLYKLLEDRYGIYVSTSREEISAISAGNKLAATLQIRKGDPVLYRKRKVYNSDGLLIEYNKVYYRGDGISYSVEIGR